MTCKDCIHYEICEENHQVSNQGTAFNFVTDGAKYCKYFKDKSNYIELPCKVGDTVYEVQKIRNRIQPLEIISVHINRNGELYFYWHLKDDIGIYHNTQGFSISRLGNTVFLTKSEAEQKLKELRENGNV